MTTATAPAGVTTTDFRKIGLEQLHESPKNPRKHFDKAKLEELSHSIERSGILTPLTVRPRSTGSGYEIAAGHRRRRAAQLVVDRTGRSFDVPCVVRDLGDAEFMEILVVENGQREDVHPLEEAQGYFELMQDGIGYDIPKIAERVGRHKDTVYDRLKLLSLIPKAKELFLDHRFTLQHAIILARLSATDQERAIDPKEARGYRPAMFETDKSGELFDGENEQRRAAAKQDPWATLKPRSVREFQDWVNDYVRFDTADPSVGNLFPETADAVTSAEEGELKVIHITHNAQIRDEARDDSQRTYGPMSWTRADGQDGSKECEHSVLGVIVVGPGRGESLAVCIAKKKCMVHYGKEIRAREKREREGSKNGASSAVAREQKAYERQQEQWQREEKQRELARARWRKAAPAIAEAVAERVRNASLTVLSDIIASQIRVSKRAGELVSKGRSADDLLRYFAFGYLEGRISESWNGYVSGADVAKRMGVNVKKILEETAPLDKAEKGK